MNQTPRMWTVSGTAATASSSRKVARELANGLVTLIQRKGLTAAPWPFSWGEYNHPPGAVLLSTRQPVRALSVYRDASDDFLIQCDVAVRP